MAAYSGKMVTWEQAASSDLNLQPAKYAWDAEAPAVAVATRRDQGVLSERLSLV